MKNRTFNLIGGLIGGAALLLSGTAANAVSVVYNTNVNATLCVDGTGQDNNQNTFIAAMNGCGGFTEQYKAELQGDSGPFAASYNTTFANTAQDPADATIAHLLGTASIACSSGNPCLLGIKDGATSPFFYVYYLTNWDGLSSIVMTGFWPNQGAISNVTIYGGTRRPPPGDVPEPGTLALLGLGLLGLGMSRRRKV